MKRFMQWREQTSQNGLGIVHGNNWGDWLAVNETTPLDYIDTVFFAYSGQLMAEMAAVIGRDADAEHYRRATREDRGVCSEVRRNRTDNSRSIHKPLIAWHCSPT